MKKLFFIILTTICLGFTMTSCTKHEAPIIEPTVQNLSYDNVNIYCNDGTLLEATQNTKDFNMRLSVQTGVWYNYKTTVLNDFMLDSEYAARHDKFYTNSLKLEDDIIYLAQFNDNPYLRPCNVVKFDDGLVAVSLLNISIHKNEFINNKNKFIYFK